MSNNTKQLEHIIPGEIGAPLVLRQGEPLDWLRLVRLEKPAGWHTFNCEKCGAPTNFKGASLVHDYRCEDDPHNWIVGCTRCCTGAAYWIELGRLFDAGLFEWVRHLSGKAWFQQADFFNALSRLASYLDKS